MIEAHALARHFVGRNADELGQLALDVEDAVAQPDHRRAVARRTAQQLAVMGLA